VPTLIVTKPFFSIPAAITIIVYDNVVVEPVIDSPVNMAATPIVGSSMVEINEEEEPIFQEPIANHEEEKQLSIQDVAHNEPPRRSQRVRYLS
jgi:hypothetical protein